MEGGKNRQAKRWKKERTAAFCGCNDLAQILFNQSTISFFFIQAWHTGFWVVHRFYTIPRYILFSPSFRSFGTHRNFERKERKHTLCDSIIISSMVPYFYFEIYSVPCVFFLLLSLSHSSLIVTEKYYAVWDILGLILPRSRSSLFTRPFREKINPFGTGDVLRFFLSTNFSGHFLN